MWDAPDGWTCVNCHTGCTTDEILAAMGLHVRSLAPDGPQMSLKAIREGEAQRAREEAHRKAERRRKGKMIDQARYWEGEVYRIGKLLAEDFDSAKLAKQLHWALDRSRTAQAAIRPFFHPANIPGEIQ